MSYLYMKLKEINEKPELLFERRSLTLLRGFIEGYCERQYDICASREVVVKFDLEFKEYVLTQYEVSSVEMPWCDIVLENCGSEIVAFDTFFVLLDSFLKYKGFPHGINSPW